MIRILLKLFGLPPYEFLYEQHYFRAPKGMLSLVMLDTCFDGLGGGLDKVAEHYHSVQEFALDKREQVLGMMDQEEVCPRKPCTLFELIDDHGRVLKRTA